MSKDEKADELTRVKSYTYDGKKGWRRYRWLSPFRGMYHDVRRRLPYLWSDYKDGFSYRTLAGTVRIFFVNLLPALAFLLDMQRRTGGFYGVNEALFSSALAAFTFSLFSAQPITIVGITGLISLFNYTIYDIVKIYDVSVYPEVMVWTGIWAAIFHWIFAIFNVTDYMRYVTDFSSQSFGLYVPIIYCIKGVEELISLFDAGLGPGYLSIVIALLFFGTTYALEAVGTGRQLPSFVRGLLSDYAYPIATIFWTGFSHINGTIKSTPIEFLPVTKAFYPSTDRPWVIPFWTLSADWVFTALPFGFLTMLLFWYDHNISSITAQARTFPLKKPGGFHWDFFLLGCTTFVSGIIGLPFPNGLVPQAPVHTDALTTYKVGVKKLKSDDDEPGDERVIYPQPTREAVKVDEQRISHLLMCLALFGTMSGPLLRVLATIPRGLFAGVFFIVGWGGIESNRITKTLLFLITERRYVPSDSPLLQVPRKQIIHFIFWQILDVAACVAISQTIAAIGFPILIIALIPLRWKVFPKWFTPHELACLDDLTAESEVVLASLGGAPPMPTREGQVLQKDKDKHESREARELADERKRFGGVV